MIARIEIREFIEKHRREIDLDLLSNALSWDYPFDDSHRRAAVLGSPEIFKLAESEDVDFFS